MTDHYPVTRAQKAKGRNFETRAVNVHIYSSENQPALTQNFAEKNRLGRHITLVDADTGHEITMDAEMFDFIVATGQSLLVK